ncbi:MAG TPA: FCD domain-containing protein, partial [Candidatus Limnocylindria bacterium]|nr:FCD domain-containing protein [Candidatus Limnocylindria bacterium]
SIRGYIVDNNLRAGDRLPSEAELCEILGYSRPSIRESLKILEGSGLVKTRRGKGRFVTDSDYGRMVEEMTYHFRIHYRDFMEVVEVRKALETQFLPKITGLLQEEDFRALGAVIDEMEDMARRDSPADALVEAHARFHRRLYQALGNKLLDSLISMFATIQRTLSIHRRINTSGGEAFIRKHRELLESLRSADPQRVLACFSDHFSDYERQGS